MTVTPLPGLCAPHFPFPFARAAYPLTEGCWPGDCPFPLRPYLNVPKIIPDKQTGSEAFWELCTQTPSVRTPCPPSRGPASTLTHTLTLPAL